MSVLHRLSQWYERHCDSQWEHRYGISLDTLDNPGWQVSIDLTATELDGLPFTPVSREESPRDWIVCRVEAGKFVGYGGPHDLEEILTTFLDWAERER